MPQKKCLSCDGCCRFKDESSRWRPKAIYFDPVLEEDLDGSNYLKADETDGVCHCRFFDLAQNKCRIYPSRPFECQLYPVMLLQTDRGVAVSVHLGCPVVQEKLGSDDFADYEFQLKQFFEKPEIKELLCQDPGIAGDFSTELTNSRSCSLLNNNMETELIQYKEVMEGYVRKEKRPLSPASFTSVFAWKESFNSNFK